MEDNFLILLGGVGVVLIVLLFIAKRVAFALKLALLLLALYAGGYYLGYFEKQDLGDLDIEKLKDVDLKDVDLSKAKESGEGAFMYVVDTIEGFLLSLQGK